MRDYKFGLKEKKINLDDDFIKFVRFAQHLLHDGVGVLGLITNNVYLDGLTHRRMRQCLSDLFSQIWLLDLHGSVKKLETSRRAESEENVFDIQQGVAVSIFLRTSGSTRSAIEHSELWGSRDSKYQHLNSATALTRFSQTLKPQHPYFFFVPKDLSYSREYANFTSITEIYSVYQNAIKTDRDALFFDFQEDSLSSRMKRLFSGEYDSEFRSRFAIQSSSSYDLEDRLSRARYQDSNIKSCLYRPFDMRYIYYDPSVTSRPAAKVMRHLVGGSITALICLRQTRRSEAGTYLVSNFLINKDAVSLFDICTVFPLYLVADELDVAAFSPEVRSCQTDRRSNFKPAFLRTLADSLGLLRGTHADCSEEIHPEHILSYMYSVLYSQSYRFRYAEFLKVEFPRIPLTSSIALLRELASFGDELIALHLVEAPVQRALTAYYDQASALWHYRVEKDQRPPVTLRFTGPEKPVVGKVGWSDDTVWIDAVMLKRGGVDCGVTGTVGFRGVPEEVWNFHVGGYLVCEKWLKDRRDRTLTAEDITHYHHIVIALHETIRIMREIDEVIDARGGWPDAFQGREDKKGETSEVIETEPDKEMVPAQAARGRTAR